MIIYKATNKVNNKSYIGQTIYKLRKRQLQHIRATFNHDSTTKFHNAIRKYGIENFIWEVIDDTAKTIDELNEKEINYIKDYDVMNNGYNMTTGGMNSIPSAEVIKKIIETRTKNGSYGHTEETKKKISENHAPCSGKYNSMYGKRHTEETKEKMRKKAIERPPMFKGKKHTEKAILNMKRAYSNRKIIKCPNCDVESKNTANMFRFHFDKCGIKEKIECPHCSKVGNTMNMVRWHFDNCKNKH